MELCWVAVHGAEGQPQRSSCIDQQRIKFPVTSSTMMWAIGLYVSACIVSIDHKHFFHNWAA